MPNPTPYRTLPAPRRLMLVTHDIASSRESRDGYIRSMVTRGGGFRAEKLRKWTPEQLAREVVRHGLESPRDELNLLHTLYVEVEPELQMEFLTAAGVAHERGVMPDDLQPPFASEANVKSAAEALIAKHGDEGRRYLRAIALYNGDAWPGLVGVLG
ncbi:MAG TPA: hypothetical protein VHW65_07950 [Gemmatimonadales bacterium]|jgi:hypothetical protein|nr:hypothetical protein [Gemmatimonadales bacterium]